MFLKTIKTCYDCMLIHVFKTCLSNIDKHVFKTDQNMLRLHVNTCFQNMFIKFDKHVSKSDQNMLQIHVINMNQKHVCWKNMFLWRCDEGQQKTSRQGKVDGGRQGLVCVYVPRGRAWSKTWRWGNGGLESTDVSLWAAPRPQSLANQGVCVRMDRGRMWGQARTQEREEVGGLEGAGCRG